ncbi:MAG: hypothetical protein BWY64_03771 [bacterium ADurb.Bin363]|nr:MAG: hypothetical protein BWY64_03771 [bacterium ADurb.Bin363]
MTAHLFMESYEINYNIKNLMGIIIFNKEVIYEKKLYN